MWRPAYRESSLVVTGIDPGTNRLGIADYWLDPFTLEIQRSSAFTLCLDRYANRSAFYSELYGDRYVRLRMARALLFEHFERVGTSVLASESPFFKRRNASAFEPLIETLGAIRDAAIEYDPNIGLYRIDPISVKQCVGAPVRVPKGQDIKAPVKRAVMALSDLRYSGETPIALLDEHSIDSLAVGYTYIRRLQENRL